MPPARFRISRPNKTVYADCRRVVEYLNRQSHNRARGAILLFTLWITITPGYEVHNVSMSTVENQCSAELQKENVTHAGHPDCKGIIFIT